MEKELLQRIDRQEEAIRILAQSLDESCEIALPEYLNNTAQVIDKILHPDKPEIAD